jgi:hypothetical protein
VKRARLMTLAGWLGLAGCGYIGPPQPPALDIPVRVTDLRVAEIGDKIRAEFTLPSLTTEGLPLKSPRSVDLYVGPAPIPWSEGEWAASAKRFDLPDKGPGPLSYEAPVREWIGKDVVIAVRATGPKGKTSDWSNLQTLPVKPPLSRPVDFKAENAPQGTSLSWNGTGPKYKIFRAIGDASPEFLAETETSPYLDAPIDFGTKYQYYVEASAGDLQQSEMAGPLAIAPEDVFPPSVPEGLTAELGVNTIELSWDRNTEPRFQGYNVYRAVEGGSFEKVASLIATPAYSDRQIESGKKYRYAITAVGLNGRESARSAVFEIAAQ